MSNSYLNVHILEAYFECIHYMNWYSIGWMISVSGFLYHMSGLLLIQDMHILSPIDPNMFWYACV